MRACFLICTLFIAQFAFTQNAEKKYFFKEVGWTLVVPAEFTTLDSADNAERNERGKKAIEESNGIKADISETKTLISATKTANYFNSTITPFDPQKDGNYAEVSQSVKDMVYKTLADKMPDAAIDSSSVVESIGGLAFDKFHVTLKLNGKVLFNMFLLSKLYKGYDFGISYLYVDDEAKEQIESMLKTSKFID